jgi:hypothetical protein
MSVLRVAHYLRFESLRELAVQALHTMASPVEKLVCARDFGIDHWLKEAYTDICYRSSPLCEEEGVCLGLSTCLKIASAREAIRRSTAVIDSVHADSVIRKIFGLEMEQSEAISRSAPSTFVTCCRDKLKPLPAQSTDHVDQAPSPLIHDFKEAILQSAQQEGKLKDEEEVQRAEGKREGELYTLPQAQLDVRKVETYASEAISRWAQEAKGSLHNLILTVAPLPSTESHAGKQLKKKKGKKEAEISSTVIIELRDSKADLRPGATE